MVQNPKQMIINNPTELLNFIKREDLTVKQATEIVCKALNVITVFEKTKAELIESTEYYINQFTYSDNAEKPLFLDQLEKKFKIRDLCK
jgi:20S proteasome alpha/beta subunit